jgi:hypothetical protein
VAGEPHKSMQAKQPSFKIIGPSDERCEHCNDGESVYLIRDPFKGVESHALHERCASAFFKQGSGDD